MFRRGDCVRAIPWTHKTWINVAVFRYFQIICVYSQLNKLNKLRLYTSWMNIPVLNNTAAKIFACHPCAGAIFTCLNFRFFVFFGFNRPNRTTGVKNMCTFVGYAVSSLIRRQIQNWKKHLDRRRDAPTPRSRLHYWPNIMWKGCIPNYT